MSPDQVRAMVTAMQEAGEPDDRIEQALTLAKSREGGGAPGPAQPAPDMATVTRGAPQEEEQPEEQAKQPFLMPGRTSAVEKLRADPSNEGLGSRFVQGLAGGASKVMNGLLAGFPNAARRTIAHAVTGNDDWAKAEEAYEAAPFEMPGKLGAVNRAMGGVAEMSGATIGMHPAAQGTMGMIEQAVPALAKRAPGRVLANAITGGTVGGAYDAAKAGFKGGSVADMLDAGKSGALFGAGLGAGTSVLGEGLSAAEGALRNPRSELGETIIDYSKAKEQGRIPRNMLDPRADPPLAKEVAASSYRKDAVPDRVYQDLDKYNTQVRQDAEAKAKAGNLAAAEEYKRTAGTMDAFRAQEAGEPARASEARRAEYQATMDRAARADELGKSLKNPDSAQSRREMEEMASLDPKYQEMRDRVQAKAAFDKTRLPGPLEALTQTPGKTLKAAKAGLARFADPVLQSIAPPRLDPMTKQLQGLPDEPGIQALAGWIPGIDEAVTTAKLKKAQRMAQMKLDLEKDFEARRKKQRRY